MTSEKPKIPKYKPNERQRAAIQHTDGPLLIIAGPGAGKTMTLVERVVYLVTGKQVEPQALMVATFTEKAAKELITRISNRLLELDLRVNLNEMYIGTLHSIFLRLLEEYREFTRLKRNFRLLDQFDQQYFIYNNIFPYLAIEDIDALVGSKGNHWHKAKIIASYVSRVGEECLDVARLSQAEEAEIRALSQVYQLYEQQLQEELGNHYETTNRTI